jgi:hypothetical protein
MFKLCLAAAGRCGGPHQPPSSAIVVPFNDSQIVRQSQFLPLSWVLACAPRVTVYRVYIDLARPSIRTCFCLSQLRPSTFRPLCVACIIPTTASYVLVRRSRERSLKSALRVRYYVAGGRRVCCYLGKVVYILLTVVTPTSYVVQLRVTPRSERIVPSVSSVLLCPC